MRALIAAARAASLGRTAALSAWFADSSDIEVAAGLTLLRGRHPRALKPAALLEIVVAISAWPRWLLEASVQHLSSETEASLLMLRSWADAQPPLAEALPSPAVWLGDALPSLAVADPSTRLERLRVWLLSASPFERQALLGSVQGLPLLPLSPAALIAALVSGLHADAAILELALVERRLTPARIAASRGSALERKAYRAPQMIEGGSDTRSSVAFNAPHGRAVIAMRDAAGHCAISDGDGQPIGSRLPELLAICATWPLDSLALLIVAPRDPRLELVFDGRWRSPRASKTSLETPPALLICDVARWAGRDLAALPVRARLNALEGIALPAGSSVARLQSLESDHGSALVVTVGDGDFWTCQRTLSQAHHPLIAALTYVQGTGSGASYNFALRDHDGDGFVSVHRSPVADPRLRGRLELLGKLQRDPRQRAIRNAIPGAVIVELRFERVIVSKQTLTGYALRGVRIASIRADLAADDVATVADLERLLD